MPDLADGACDVCGGALVGPYWVHERQKLVHTKCRAWESVAWPFEATLKTLRESWSAADPDGRARIAAVGLWLRQRKSRWPRDASETAVELERRIAGLGRLVRT